MHLLHNFHFELDSSSLVLVLDYFLFLCMYLRRNFRYELYSSSMFVVCIHELLLLWEKLEIQPEVVRVRIVAMFVGYRC
jgi:hypothetical protein